MLCSSSPSISALPCTIPNTHILNSNVFWDFKEKEEYKTYLINIKWQMATFSNFIVVMVVTADFMVHMLPNTAR